MVSATASAGVLMPTWIAASHWQSMHSLRLGLQQQHNLFHNQSLNQKSRQLNNGSRFSRLLCYQLQLLPSWVCQVLMGSLVWAPTLQHSSI
jgi:hypothetical protein